jgi:hypothetical protein
VNPAWLRGFPRHGASFDLLTPEPLPWWDRELVTLLRRHGPARFRRLAIWDHDWNAVAIRLGHEPAALGDPRGPWERVVHALLARTQGRRGTWPVRGLEFALRLTGW